MLTDTQAQAAKQRLFVAAWVNRRSWQELRRLIAALSSQGPAMRWIEPERWHLTLRFLGAVAVDRLQPLVDGLGMINWPFPLSIEATMLAPFPPARPVTLALEIRPAQALDDLAGAVDNVLSAQGFTARRRPFTPHLSLARGPRQSLSHWPRINGRWNLVLDRGALVASRLGHRGADYLPLVQWPKRCSAD